MLVEPDQLARSEAALDAWFDPGPGGYRVPGLTWDQCELENMHAALEAPTTDAALEAFGVAPGSYLSTPEQDARNRALMTELRQAAGRLGPEPESRTGGLPVSTPDSYPDRLEGQHADKLAKTEAAAQEAETDLSPEAQDVLRVNLNQIAEHDAIEGEAEQRFADYWGGTGPDYEAQASRDGGPWPEEPWWDSEKQHGAEAEAGEAEAGSTEPEVGQ